jgi:hypothetical protein
MPHSCCNCDAAASHVVYPKTAVRDAIYDWRYVCQPCLSYYTTIFPTLRHAALTDEQLQ